MALCATEGAGNKISSCRSSSSRSETSPGNRPETKSASVSSVPPWEKTQRSGPGMIPPVSHGSNLTLVRPLRVEVLPGFRFIMQNTFRRGRTMATPSSSLRDRLKSAEACRKATQPERHIPSHLRQSLCTCWGLPAFSNDRIRQCAQALQ